MNDDTALMDIESIKQLKARYCRYLDTKDWDRWRDLFTDDFFGDTTEAGGTLIVGVDEFMAYTRNTIGKPSQATVHQVHGPEIEPRPTTTTTSATASGPRIGEPCSDWSKIARDPSTGLTIICDGATGAGAAPPHWTTDDLSHVIGVQTIGTSCAGSQPYAMAISPDDYLVACFPSDGGSDQLAGQGSTWQIYHP